MRIFYFNLFGKADIITIIINVINLFSGFETASSRESCIGYKIWRGQVRGG